MLKPFPVPLIEIRNSKQNDAERHKRDNAVQRLNRGEIKQKDFQDGKPEQADGRPAQPGPFSPNPGQHQQKRIKDPGNGQRELLLILDLMLQNRIAGVELPQTVRKNAADFNRN